LWNWKPKWTSILNMSVLRYRNLYFGSGHRGNSLRLWIILRPHLCVCFILFWVRVFQKRRGYRPSSRYFKFLVLLVFLVLLWHSRYTGWMLSTGFGSEFASRCSVSAQDGSWIPVYLLPTRLWHLWPLPPAICWPWSPRFPTCETCFVWRTFICIRRPFKLELTSCLP